MQLTPYSQVFTSLRFKARPGSICTYNQSVQFKVTLYVHNSQKIPLSFA